MALSEIRLPQAGGRESIHVYMYLLSACLKVTDCQARIRVHRESLQAAGGDFLFRLKFSTRPLLIDKQCKPIANAVPVAVVSSPTTQQTNHCGWSEEQGQVSWEISWCFCHLLLLWLPCHLSLPSLPATRVGESTKDESGDKVKWPTHMFSDRLLTGSSYSVRQN